MNSLIKNKNIVAQVYGENVYVCGGKGNKLLSFNQKTLFHLFDIRQENQPMTFEEVIENIEYIYLDVLRKNPNINFTDEQFQSLELIKEMI